MSAFFVTGTDTNAGKTYLGRILLAAACARGSRAIGYKPIESGCPNPGQPGPDALALADAASTSPETSYTLRAPIAPHAAARREAIALDCGVICNKVQELSKKSDFLIVEGAGGFMVPISEDQSMADLAVTLNFPLLIATPNRLGAINHSLLTIEAVQTRNLTIAAVVLCDVEAGAGQGLDNFRALQEFSTVQVLHLPHISTEQEFASAGVRLLEALAPDTKSKR